MANSAKLTEFIRKNCTGLLFMGLIFFVVIFSAATLTTKPKLWMDESVTMELAHSFSEFGALDVQIGPGQFSGLSHLLQSTGYPLTVILALAFKFFGYSLVTERIVMLLLMVVFLTTLFFFGKKIFGKEKALLSIILVVSFASFYGSGRTAVGEIPGLIFLIAGLYFWLSRGAYYWSGLFFGLAMVTKPSVFLLILPAMILAFLLERKGFFKKILKIGLGITPAIAGWAFLVLKDPFAKSVWFSILNYYKNPFMYMSESLAANVVNNLTNFFHSTTLIYFGILFFIIVFGRYWLEDQRLKPFFNFVIFYGIIAFAYYLRSPGWLRYILIAEILILSVIPSALSVIFLRFKELVSRIKITGDKLTVIVVLFLVAIQFINLFTAAQIYRSDSAIKTASFINEKFPEESIGVINALGLSVLLESGKKYQSVDLYPIAFMGRDFLLSRAYPEVVIFSLDEKLSQGEEIVIDNYYEKFVNMNGYEIRVLKENNK